ncbi:MAG: hypothetical protein HY692_06240 [Cyanobacteria bacterium NC_groundwater_1444_Ag_S-0.65um_54_12]|nr:hypothetical protein [Cyanobacteria bacterium NC_groundwater_1444_Ag_S-0.65um_54_12]
MPKKPKLALATLLLFATTLFGTLPGCGGDIPSRGGNDGASVPTNQNPPDNRSGGSNPDQNPVKREPVPTGPQTADPGDVPANIPKPIPTPEPPITPGEVKVRAIAQSISSYPLNPFGNYGTLVNIHIDLKWQLYPGATAYRISRNDDGGEQFILKATIPAGNIAKQWPFYWREYSLPSSPLVPGNNYKYLVEALNTSNRVIAKGNDATKPLYPLGIPKLQSPDNNAKDTDIQPSFQWEKVNNADGYFVEVFSGSNFLPQWRGFKAGQDNIVIKYGESGEGYPGTLPSIWTVVLVRKALYSWTVTAYKTDTGNAMTAKAFAKSNAPSWIFRP